MIGEFKALFDLVRTLPEPVGYEFHRQVYFPLPIELGDITRAREPGIAIAYLRIDNFSNQEKRDIRILYSGNWSYEPAFRYSRRQIPVKYSVNKVDKEVAIGALPPNETVDIAIFDPDREFAIEQVLIGDVMITDLMRRRAEFKRYPAMRWLMLAPYFTGLLILAASGAGAYAWWKTNEVQREAGDLLAVTSKLDGCVSSFVNADPENWSASQARLNRLGVLETNLTLRLNDVDTIDELKGRTKFIICEKRHGISGR